MILENNLTSISPEFIQHITKMLRAEEKARFLNYCILPLRKSIRVNTLKISINDFQKRVSAYQWKLTPIPWCKEGFWLERPEQQEKSIPLGNTGEHLMGLFYIQEASSMLPPGALFKDFQPQTVLDMAAAPGSKTTQIACYMENKGLLIANELSSSRLKGLFSNLQRCGVSNTSLLHLNASQIGSLTGEKFDAILLDAPCSGEGTIRKDPEALLNWNLASIKKMAQLQKQLIISAFTALKPGGRLVYSTCTLSMEENQQVCQHLTEAFSKYIKTINLKSLFSESTSSLTSEGYLHVFPHHYDSEGFFVACFEKTSSLNNDNTNNRKKGKFPFSRLSKKYQNMVFDYYLQHFGLELKSWQSRIWQRQNEIWLFPENIEDFTSILFFDRVGLKIAELHSENIRTQHEFAILVGHKIDKHYLELTSEEAMQFYQGRNLACMRFVKKSEVLMKYQGFPLGIGKQLDKQIKNLLPRNLVRDTCHFDNH